MRLTSFRVAGQSPTTPRVGACLPDGRIVDLVEALRGAGQGLPESPDDPLRWLDLDAPWLEAARVVVAEIVSDAKAAARLEQRGSLHEAGSLTLGAPVPRPGKILCIGLNYRDHAAESGKPIPARPILFSKFPTAVIGPEAPIVLPHASAQVDYEAELGVVIGRRAKRIARERALDHVAGYLNVNDVSARDLQFGDGQWQRGKSCDTFAPMGPWLVTSDEIADPGHLEIRLRLNGAAMQQSSTSNLIFGVPDLIAFLSETITLEPGDVIATGTPAGVGWVRKPPVFLKPGDRVEVEVQGLGVLANPVVAEE
jgi:2-keto-4-pentenoate hydratase/2-oxohepta-3-ene-1,7-dioic acid hydratase in catechol pathway